MTMLTLIAQDLRSPSISIIIIIASTAVLAYLSFLIHRAFLTSLSHIPGPLICKFTSFWLWYHTYIGDECDSINDLHQLYGPVVRIGPNDCVISDGAALAPIYSERGGFAKAPCYANFDFEGHSTIFSAIDVEHRAKRSKSVTPLFSTASIRSKSGLFDNCAELFAARLRREGCADKPVNLLPACRRLALESVSSYLFETSYGSFEEDSEDLSAASYVDGAVAIGRFFLLPNWMFLLIEQLAGLLTSVPTDVKKGISSVHEFSASLASEATSASNTYQGRLKRVGISDNEIAVQAKDLIFAGTDSTGTVLANICWWLSKKPEVYAKLKAEVYKADTHDPSQSYNPQNLAYLDAIVREGLRLAQANPTRFPRVVPSGGWIFAASDGKTYCFPAGTIVGCQPATLHFNSAVFKDATDFDPERWLRNPSGEMQRDFIPFNLGARQCIARNMAQYELLVAVRALARNGTLDRATLVTERVEIVQWFNSRTTTGRIDIRWPLSDKP